MDIDWNSIAEEDLRDEIAQMYRDCGAGIVRFLVESRGGSAIYIPSLVQLRRQLRDEQIRRRYDGSNDAELARRFGVSRHHVRTILDAPHVPPVE